MPISYVVVEIAMTFRFYIFFHSHTTRIRLNYGMYQSKIEHNLHVEKLLISLSHDPVYSRRFNIFVGIFLNYYQHRELGKNKLKRKNIQVKVGEYIELLL